LLRVPRRWLRIEVVERRPCLISAERRVDPVVRGCARVPRIDMALQRAGMLAQGADLRRVDIHAPGELGLPAANDAAIPAFQ